MSGQIIGFVCILQLIHFVGISIIFPIVIKHISGPTEFEILQNLEEIVGFSLPLDKLKLSYTAVNTAKNFILNCVTFCQSRVDVSL